jgi:transposase-like protein
VRRWVVDAEIDVGTRPGLTSTEHAEIKALKAKVRRLEEDNAILKATTTFFCLGARCARASLLHALQCGKIHWGDLLAPRVGQLTVR